MTTHLPPSAPLAPNPPVAPSSDWARISAAMGDAVPDLAERDDLVVHCAPGAGRGNPACYLPALNFIEVDGDHLPCDPATCDPSVPVDRGRYPAIWGALVHEAAHARHSRWPLPTTPGTAAAQVKMQLEESRVECAHLGRRPIDRLWLRACVQQLVLADFTDDHGVTDIPTTPWGAGSAAALLLARVGAGVLEFHEVTAIAQEVAAVLGRATLDSLHGLWVSAHQTEDTDDASLDNLARRWCRLLGVDPDTPPPQESAPANPGASPIATTVQECVEAVTASIPAPTAEQEEAAARRSAQTQADQVFGHAPSPSPGNNGSSSGTPVGSRRPPTPSEQTAARRVARQLKDAGSRERPRTRVPSAVPPGRLRMGQVIAAEAQRAAGTLPTATPFVRTTRRRTPVPPLRVGIACDVSGSMRRWTRPVAAAAWILARACTHLPDATSATVLFGEQVTALSHPGRAPTKVTRFRAKDGEHDLTRAIDALDGALDLATPGAARLLVVISDGVFEHQQLVQAPKRLTRLAASGCALLWLAPDTPDVQPMDPVPPTRLNDPATSPEAIARAAAEALRNA